MVKTETLGYQVITVGSSAGGLCGLFFLWLSSESSEGYCFSMHSFPLMSASHKASNTPMIRFCLSPFIPIGLAISN